MTTKSPKQPIRIFISYRRSDSSDIAGRLHEHLIQAVGADAVFKDSEDIPPGADWRGVLRREIARSDVVLVLIGKQWLATPDAAGKRRLDDPNDWVRFEVESALQMDEIRVIPVLLNGAPIPAADDLPLPLRELAFKNAHALRPDPDFKIDVERLVRGIQRNTGITPTEKPVNRAGGKLRKLGGCLSALLAVIVTAAGGMALLRQTEPTPTVIAEASKEVSISPTEPASLVTPTPTSPLIVTEITNLNTAIAGNPPITDITLLNAWLAASGGTELIANAALNKLAAEHAAVIANYTTTDITEKDLYLFNNVLTVTRKKQASGYEYDPDAAMIVLVQEAGTPITLQAVLDESSRLSIPLRDYREYGFAVRTSANQRQNLVLVLGKGE
jgi:hypothetical protein